MISEILCQLLDNQTTADDRVYPSVRPDSVTPAITFDEYSGGSMQSSNGPQGIAMLRVQLTCFGATHREAATLADEVRLKLNGFKGYVGTYEVKHILLIPYSRRTVPAVDASNEPQTEHGISMDFNIFHTELTV